MMIEENRLIKLLLILSVLSFMVTVPHVIEDFHYGVPESFGVNPSIAGLLVGLGFAVQVAGIIGITRRAKWGLIITLLVAAVWVLGAILDHLPDIVSSSPYREGVLSRTLEVFIILNFSALFALSGIGLKQGMKGREKFD